MINLSETSLVVPPGRASTWLIRSMSFTFTYFGALCVGYFVAAAAFGGVLWISHPVSIVIECLAAIETLWYFCWFLPYRKHLQRRTKGAMLQPPPLTREERAAFFSKCLSLIPDMEMFIRKWCQNAHLDDVRRDNVKDWLLWGLFDREGPPGDDDEELEHYVMQAEAKLGWEIKKGRGDCEAIKISFDEVLVDHRSLFYYSMIGLVDMLTTICLYLLGFSFYRTKMSTFFKIFPFRPLGLLGWNESAARDHMSYFCRPHKSKTQRPIIFIHGVGAGLFPYINYFRTIPRDVGVIAIELLPISSRISPPLPSASEMTMSIAAILEQQGPAFNDVVLVANSYGTFLTTPLLLSPHVAPKISSLVLVDPVAFLLHLPDVAYNFTRRVPKRFMANHWEMHMVARDPNLAHTLGRRLSWRDHILWRELLLHSSPSQGGAGGVGFGDSGEVAVSGAEAGTRPAATSGRRTTVIIGEKDCIIDAAAVASYVEYDTAESTPMDLATFAASEKWWNGSRPIELIWLPGEDHGSAFLKPSKVPTVVRVVSRYCNKDFGFAERELKDGSRPGTSRTEVHDDDYDLEEQRRDKPGGSGDSIC
ncbi:hypothetical protein PoMZ_07581 [Pyricularia oryzae]|uniref:AB hydrolase-1 domain-containing protein n=1 Tax=Pyricularia oryzae TaxID=318829 RepID=A0A4P7NFH5_PYROR|nr:hypothetical protein PoMZ_07581 [Pyricularia oryzae]